MTLPQEQIVIIMLIAVQNSACQLDVLVNAPHEEYEMTIDISNIPFFWDVVQLAELINSVF